MKQITLTARLALMATFLLPGVAFAKDAVSTRVADAKGGIVTLNGALGVPGTYALGTLKLDYIVEGTQFPLGLYKTPSICFKTVAANTKPVTKYSAIMDIEPIGGDDIELTPNPSQVSFFGLDEEHCIDLAIYIPSETVNNPENQVNGANIVANIRLTTPRGTYLDTVTNIQVRLTLMYPNAEACIVPLHFVSDNDFAANISATPQTTISYNLTGPTLSSNPNQPSHSVALVNTCDDSKTVDLSTVLNTNWDLIATNAIRTTTSNQEYVDIAALLVGEVLPGPTAIGPSCFEDVLIPGHKTFVLAQRMSIKNSANFPGTYATSIGRGLGSWDYTGFNFNTYAPVAGAGNCGTGSTSTDVDPASGSTLIPVSSVTFSGPGKPANETRPVAP